MSYDNAITILKSNGFDVRKRVLATQKGDAVVMNLLVEVSPILIYEKMEDIKRLLPEFDVVSWGTNSGVGEIAIHQWYFMSSLEREDRKMAVINLTCDYPFKYCIATLSEWSGLSYVSVKRIVRMLNLDVKSGENIKWRKEFVQEKLRKYLPKQLIPQQ